MAIATRIYTEQLHVSYDKLKIINDLSIEIPTGKITALVGANGSGKSTILKAMSRLLKPTEGTVFLDGHSIHHQSTKEIAKKLAILPQSPSAPEGITAEELVGYGRFPHQRGFQKMSSADREIINWAFEVTGMTAFKDRPIDHLSGGQRQRVWIAMALAQQTDMLFLDEPTTYLDMAHQLEVLCLLKEINERHNTTIVMVVHDLNHATRYADHLIAIKSGNVVYEGAPMDIVTPQMLLDVFAIHADVIVDKRAGVPLCIPYGLVSDDEVVAKEERKVAVTSA
ncbi:ABC transporter ATP-binding protein [Paenibacillus sp. LjRoot56]|uniref:ABC transporter ATP-binding protein n=1 Tax=Paenibacillus sp. LjRoot56 TaxID=3342333 RepID=UPI003ECF8851